MFKDYFNTLIDGENELGDLLFGDKDEFEFHVKQMDNDNKKVYVDALVEKELIDQTNL